MKMYRLPQLIGYIDVKRFNKSMIEFHENIDKLNDLVSVFPKLGIPVTTEVLQELCDDYEAMCDKYFGIISERILNELSAQPDGLDIENYEKEINQLKTHFNAMYLQLIISQYFISNKSGIWSLSLIVHSKG